jgi:UDP-N-acetylmuramate--alanine ligase
VIKYGFSEQADICGEIIELNQSQSRVSIYRYDLNLESRVRERVLLGTVTLNIPGAHNILNALAATALCLEFEIPFATIATALESFKGVERRFEFKGIFNGAEIFDDYGHHPTEIKNTLLVAQKRRQKKLHVVFQPHRFTRTEKLWQEFVNLFISSQNKSVGELYKVDTLYLTDIYPASEDPIPNITSERLAREIRDCAQGTSVYYFPTYAQITKELHDTVQEGDLVLTIGAGKVNQIAEVLVAMSKQTK